MSAINGFNGFNQDTKCKMFHCPNSCVTLHSMRILHCRMVLHKMRQSVEQVKSIETRLLRTVSCEYSTAAHILRLIENPKIGVKNIEYNYISLVKVIVYYF